MAEATAFVFCMDISGAQPAVCSSYQNVVGSKGFGSRLVYKVLCLCVVADRFNLIGCHTCASNAGLWTYTRSRENRHLEGAFEDRNQAASRTFSTQMLTSIAKMLSCIETTPDRAGTKTEKSLTTNRRYKTHANAIHMP